MHCYEVIPEGAVCKLYFDLEFDVASNAHLDGSKMVASLIQVKKNKNTISIQYHLEYLDTTGNKHNRLFHTKQLMGTMFQLRLLFF